MLFVFHYARPFNNQGDSYLFLYETNPLYDVILNLICLFISIYFNETGLTY